MTQFKVGDEVRLVRCYGIVARRKKGIVLSELDAKTSRHLINFNGVTLWIPADIIRHYVKRTRPTLREIKQLKIEIQSKNKEIAKLNSDCLTYQSKIADLGDRLAHIQLQRDSLRKQIEVVDAEHDAQIIKLKDANHDSGRILVVTEHENATLALELMAWKAAAAVMSIFAIGIGAVLAFG